MHTHTHTHSCLDHPIPPCRSLCDTVQSSCEVTMSRYGYPWPEIVKCDQFPSDNDMCISEQHARGGVEGLRPSSSSSPSKASAVHFDVYLDGTPKGVTSSSSSSRDHSSTESSNQANATSTRGRHKKRKKKRKHHHHHHPPDHDVNQNSRNTGNNSSHSQPDHHRDHRIISGQGDGRIPALDISRDPSQIPSTSSSTSSMIDAASSSTPELPLSGSSSSLPASHMHHHLQNFDQLQHELHEGTTSQRPAAAYPSIPSLNDQILSTDTISTTASSAGTVLSASSDASIDEGTSSSRRASGQHLLHGRAQMHSHTSEHMNASSLPLSVQMRFAYCMSEWSLKARGRLSLDSLAGHQLSSNVHANGTRIRIKKSAISLNQVSDMANMPDFLFIQIQGYKILHGSFEVSRDSKGNPPPSSAPPAPPAGKNFLSEITIPNSVMQQFVQLIQQNSHFDDHELKHEKNSHRMRRASSSSRRSSRKRSSHASSHHAGKNDWREGTEKKEEAKSIRFYIMGFTSGPGQHLASFLMPWNSRDKEFR